jgi:hypothetical protein
VGPGRQSHFGRAAFWIEGNSRDVPNFVRCFITSFVGRRLSAVWTKNLNPVSRY